MYQITRQSQAEFAGQRLSLAEIDSELFHSLYHTFISSATITEVVSSCEKMIYQRMEKSVVSDALLLATKVIAEHHGHVKVADVAKQSHYSERHLNRLFLTQIGTNIKSYARLTRFHYVVKCIQNAPCPFVTLSQQAGYFDQAHFNKDFKSICGCSPQTYLKTMSDFYYDATEICSTISSKEE